ncbi:MAG: hypothetical protein JWM19_4305, partial [Actinomycetia bacterium]|nr:hypothetical protein [Actinomycetes bacterium]
RDHLLGGHLVPDRARRGHQALKEGEGRLGAFGDGRVDGFPG